MMERMRRKQAAEAEPPPGAERRRDVRQASLLEVAKLGIGGHEELCRLRGVSADGLRAEVYCPAAAGERVAIELRTGHCIVGHVSWADGGIVGVSFDEPTPMMEMLSHCSFDERVTSVRSPRLTVDVEATLFVDHFKLPARISNISQSGLKLMLDDMFDADTPCTIAIDHLGPLPGEIKWWRDGEGGVMFEELIPYPAFADWRLALNPGWRMAGEAACGPAG